MFLRYHDLLDFSYGNCTLYWICNIAKFSSLRWSGELRHVTVPSFVKNSQSVAEILRFFDCHSCHFLILEIAKFYWLTLSGDPSHITVLNVTKIGQSVAKILWFFIFFKMAAFRHLGFVLGIFGPPTECTWWSLSLFRIWLWSMQLFR